MGRWSLAELSNNGKKGNGGRLISEKRERQ
jgi:hypothetical protein